MITASLAPDTKAAQGERRSRFAFGLTRRALLLLLAGTFWLVPGFFHPHYAWGMAVWDLALLVAFAIDARRLPRPDELRAQRVWLGPLALANETEVELGLAQVKNAGVRLRCAVIDDLGAALSVSPPEVEIEVLPAGRAAGRYRLIARERGDQAVGLLYVRYRTWHGGLVERWARMPLRQTVRVYPTVRASAEQGLFLARSRQIELQQRLHRQRGLGRDFESLRDYRDGDDLRDICWTATARRGVPITRVYQTEKSQAVWVLIDAGRLQGARVGRYTKLDYATTTALALAQLALLSGDRVGLLAYGAQVQRRVGLGRGAGHLRAIMESLAQVRGEYGEADHLNATVQLMRLQPRRSLVLWITDVAETSMRPEVVDGAVQLMRRHLVLFVAMRQADLVLEAASKPRTAHEMFRVAAAQELVHRRAVLLAQLRERGALTIETDPASMTGAVLNRYLEVKEKSML